jgi:biopolymer transport protein ExbD
MDVVVVVVVVILTTVVKQEEEVNLPTNQPTHTASIKNREKREKKKIVIQHTRDLEENAWRPRSNNHYPLSPPNIAPYDDGRKG